ncbi:hypothetical protein [Crassaminicella profunda]|uniref:hypothetical protein n=1 Tax=Crassaminicella profunda TaxID=1286698 RepID=UPI001CA63001|nr:hypothetical protein [Crassaminicella profunda]QZY54465.1 hypothetical protein K7H06_15680 [Crassaminicella profunda]
MFFSSIDKNFFVLTTIQSSKYYSSYICKKRSSSSEQLYLVNEYKNRNIINSYLPLLIKLHKQKEFSQLSQLFVKDSKVYLIFKYKKSSLLSTGLLKNQFTLHEKVKIANSFIISLLKINKLPHSIQYEILNMENINLDSNNEIYLNYFLNFVQSSDQIMPSAVMNKIGFIISNIFEKEKNLPLPLKLFIEKLYDHQFKSLSEIYATFQQIQKDLLTNNEVEEKETLFSKIAKYKYILIVSMILIAAIYFYVWEYESVTTSTEPTIKQIGTVEVD